MKKFLSTLALAGIATATLASCGKEKLTVWVSESTGVKELAQQQIKDFQEANPDVDLTKWDIVVEGVSEADAATQMIADVASGADIFCFAQDQLARLVQAGAVTEIADAITKRLKETNDAGSISAATVGGKMYCYPLTSDNGYYMYYDKSVIKAEHLDSLEDIIKDCEDNQKLFCMELQSSAWYNAAFFFATGCSETYKTNDKGEITACESDWNSDKGVIALRGMQRLLKSQYHKSDSGTNNFANGAAVVVSGTWGSADAKKALGDNYAATDLPSFTIDGKSYHLGSFSGNKLMGVKPQQNAEKAAACQLLAEYLTNEKCQLERFDLVGWGPSNKKAQQNDAVKNDPALAALALQSAYATPQGNIHGQWWDIAKAYCDDAKDAALDDTAALKETLKKYQDNLDRILNGIKPEIPAAKVSYTAGGDSDWQLAGSCFNNWGPSGLLLKAVEGQENVYETENWEFKENDEFKARLGFQWTVNIGADGTLGGGNFKITADQAGKHKVRLTVTKDASGNVTGGTLELIAPDAE